MTLFVGIDPGKASGFASYDSDTGVFFSNEYATTVLYRKLERMVWAEMKPEFIIERFDINAGTVKKTAQPEAAGVIAVLEYLCIVGHANMYRSSRTRKGYATNRKLKALGWFKGGEGHSDDAARHLLAFLSLRPEGASLLERLAA
jgi:hypothetical protein